MIVVSQNRCAHIWRYMSNSNHGKRKANITDVHVEEARLLKALWKERGTLSQEEFGARYEIGTQGAIWQYLNHRTPLNPKAATAFARELKCEVRDFSPRVADIIEGFAPATTEVDEDFADIPRLSVAASAGPGHENFIEEVVGALKFRRDFLRDVGVSPANGAVINVRGRSMEPEIPDGAVLLVNRANREPRSGKPYVFLRAGQLIVKKAVKDASGRWIARSENDDRESFPDFDFDEDDQLIGRAVWVGAKL